METSPTRTQHRESYARAFQSELSANRYEYVVYAQESSATILWSVERDILIHLIKEFCQAETRQIDSLDFACGTGRIVEVIENLVSTSTAIDVSRHMINISRTKTRKTAYICGDITQGEYLDNKYDLITCFRFLTNAEEELRIKTLSALRRRLRDQDSILIVNGHGNPLSYRLLTLPYHWARDKLAGRPFQGYLSTPRLNRLLASAGFRVERRIGMGFVPEKLQRMLPNKVVLVAERMLAKVPGLDYLGLNQMFVCRRADCGTLEDDTAEGVEGIRGNRQSGRQVHGA
jgi:SAM-dependent methyltransferase